ncbi:MAG: enoyl-CoA hydratase/isomerase family protein [Pseudomonadales bacterium]|nr:enoyl-CoA hydratase/isomerase family protein [Pseudomonadales bacterium]
MHYEHVLIESQDAITTLTLNRPDCGNALSIAFMKEIIAAAKSFQQDTDTRVIIVRGAGKHFSVGADLKDPERHQQSDEDLLTRTRSTTLGRELIQTILDIDQITIAAVQGVAAGGGACIASACDFRIGSDDCRIGYPEVKLGMNLSWGSLPLCYTLIGPARTKRMVVGGELESASDLERWGFLDELVASENLQSAAMAMADHYAARPALSAQMIKRGINAMQQSNLKQVMHMDGDQFTLASLSQDYRKARDAFLNRTDQSSE